MTTLVMRIAAGAAKRHRLETKRYVRRLRSMGGLGARFKKEVQNGKF